jgi:hypothetical protein
MIAWMCAFSDCNDSESQRNTGKYMHNILYNIPGEKWEVI